MGNSAPLNRRKSDLHRSIRRKSRNLTRKYSLNINRHCMPTDGEIIHVQSEHTNKQMEYIRSCVRKDKGLFGMITENLQNKHIFSHNEPENTHIVDQTPENYHMNYQSIYLQTVDNVYLHAYWIYQIEENPSTMTILYLHGAGGNVSHRLEILQMFYENLRCNILIIDYRGFGKSSGVPSEFGLYVDAQTAYDYLVYTRQISPQRLVILGTSLGASIAIQLVSDPLNQCQLAIFENAFISIPEIAKYLLTRGKHILDRIKSITFIYLFDSLKKVSKIQCSCLYLTGLLDPMIPSWMTQTLYEQTNLARNRRLYEYPFGKHNDLPIMQNYFENIHQFIQDLDKNNI